MSSVVRKPQINAYPFEGEHVISLMVRHHLYSGIRRWDNATNPISSDYKTVVPHYVLRPLYRDVYDAFSPSIDYETFLGRHTLYRYYAPFLPATLLTQSGDKPLFVSNINRVKYAAHWRHCSECVKEDMDTIGETYYHIEHQLAGMSYCVKHQTPLFVACDSCHDSGRYLNNIGLPHGSNCPKCDLGYDNLDGYMDDDIDWVLRTSARLLKHDFPNLNLQRLQRAYRDYIGLDTFTNVSSRKDTLIIAEAQRALDNHFAPELYERLLILDGYQGNRKFRELFVSYLAYKDKLTLPICHLLMIRMLFGEIENIPNLMS
ncbi:TniQ family protein [Pseudoalteromonas sp. TB51]|uniref:TniQ family protein n=1 Tax=Pseudoalteromonas sp. TB51 TaxID=1055803 RepID=UPI00041B7166|nr:TniQ family protein [Pseudoalteromonas sp. TB51]MAD74155.1 hypothetical protein [Rheinheimera sp.]|tara:strand:+ start:5034 stop:5984 length:951 start_codon:yes stop_codon:yes gene_type:complete